MTPPTEAELHKLQSRLDMREAATQYGLDFAMDTTRERSVLHFVRGAALSQMVITLLDELEAKEGETE